MNALHLRRAALVKMKLCDVRNYRSLEMNPSELNLVDALFGNCMHAGGWPKLGWCCLDDDEEVLSCFALESVH